MQTMRRKLIFSSLIVIAGVSLLSFTPVSYSQEKKKEKEKKVLAENIDTDKIRDQVKDFQETQILLDRLKVYNKLLDNLDEKKKGLDEVVRLKKIEILQKRIKDNNEKLDLINKQRG